MPIADIPTRNDDGSVNAPVEIPRGSRNKYEYDAPLGVIALDCTLYSAVHFPTDYGVVPGTRGPDGDPLDILVLVEESVFPGCLVRVRLLGVLTITKSDGDPERKLLAVPVREPRRAQYRDVAAVPPHLLKRRSSTSSRSTRTWRAAISDPWAGPARRRPRRRSTWSAKGTDPASTTATRGSNRVGDRVSVAIGSGASSVRGQRIRDSAAASWQGGRTSRHEQHLRRLRSSPPWHNIAERLIRDAVARPDLL